jgi:hypothetical protein
VRIQDSVVTLDDVVAPVRHDRQRGRGVVDLQGTRLEYDAAGLEHCAGYRIVVRENGHEPTTLTYPRGEGAAYLEIAGKPCSLTVRQNTVFDREAVVGHVVVRGEVIDVELATEDATAGLAFIIALNAMYEWRRGLFRP